MERVLITGLGVVSALGDRVETYWDRLLTGKSHIEAFDMPEHWMDNRCYYPVQLTQKNPENGSHALLYATIAARQALRDADWPEVRASKLGVYVGTGMGCYDSIDRAIESFTEVTEATARFLDVAGPLAAALALDGPVINVSTACAAGAYSVALAMDAIARGEVDAVLAGGAEAFSIVPQGCFNRLGALDPKSCRPFSKERQGTLFGEGAAFLLLESETSFKRRGGTVAYAQARGYGMSCDGYHLTAPEAMGIQIEAAAREAISRSDWHCPVDVVVAHGTGTQLNDEVESKVMAKLFRRADHLPWTVPIKARIGHGGGSAGAFSCLTAALIMRHQMIPPSGVEEEIDAACEVKLNQGAAQSLSLHSALVNAYAFGGNNVSILFSTAQVAAS